MNFGREMGRVGRWMVGAVSWWVVGLGVAGTLAVVVSSRWPVGGVWPWFVDVKYFAWPKGWWGRVWGVGWEGTVYLMGLGLWAVTLVAWWLGTVARWLALARYRPGKFQRERARWRHTLLAVGLIFSLLGAGIGWPYRLGRLWSDQMVSSGANGGQARSGVMDGMGVESKVATLWSAVRHGRTAKHRRYAIRRLVEDKAAWTMDFLAEAEGAERDAGNRALLLRLIGMSNQAEHGELLESRLVHGSAEIRAAAADGLGFMHARAFETKAAWVGGVGIGPRTRSDPSINIFEWCVRDYPGGVRGYPLGHWMNGRRIAMPASRREKLSEMMARGSTLEEREAAARAVLLWPPQEYRLRLVEWGVWVGKGSSVLSGRETGRAPGFVHEPEDLLMPLVGRMPRATGGSKAAIHLTGSSTMSVDVEVRIRAGRPSLAYPRPDDYTLQPNVGSGKLHTDGAVRSSDLLSVVASNMNAETLRGLKDLRQGYPWLSSGFAVEVEGGLSHVGARWQNLIVNPSKLPWMEQAAVELEGPGAWWRRLRGVESSWLSVRGEGERFLYYEGDSVMNLPVALYLSSGEVHARGWVERSEGEVWNWKREFGVVPGSTRDGMLVRVRGGRVVGGAEVSVPLSPREVLGQRVPAAGVEAEEVQGRFVGALRGRGLSESEARGLMAVWGKEWFERDGDRVLLFLMREDYERLCPIRVRPAPTEVVRVGVVWIEL